jgi:uncharacterized membrane protein YphA (DoxX/SURF4 family)
VWKHDSGPAVARIFQRELALVFLIAWLSLGVQVTLLVGSHGLLPAHSWLEMLRARTTAGFLQVPTWLWLGSSDALLRGGIWLGVALSLLALAGVWPRACFALSTLLYLGYAVACRSFTGFQWDNLLLECGLLACFLPRDRPAKWIHLLFRLLLFKLYFESGLAKLQSPIGDWLDGSAMRFYYQTAPIPTALAWYAHHLPAWWHHIESNATLVWELAVPFLIFGPRRARIVAAVVFTGFQLINIATANYGFFSYLALALGVFLLDDRDLERLRAFVGGRMRRLRRRVPALRRPAARLRLLLRRWGRVRHALTPRLSARVESQMWLTGARRAGAYLFSALYIAVSLNNGLQHFDRPRGGFAGLDTLSGSLRPFRVINTYYLFTQVTRTRIEPQFSTYDGTRWTEHNFHYKAGPVGRAPPFVAPHQPRVDFLLWFYGLGFRHMPRYVGSLLEHLCREPAVVQPLFVDPLPAEPQAVRIVFYDYRFTTPAEKAATANWWQRRQIAQTRAFPCGMFTGPPMLAGSAGSAARRGRAR